MFRFIVISIWFCLAFALSWVEFILICSFQWIHFGFESGDQLFCSCYALHSLLPQLKSIETSCQLNIKIWKTTANIRSNWIRQTSERRKMDPYMNLSFGNVYEKVAPFQNCTLVLCVLEYTLHALSHLTHSNRNVYHKLIFNCIKNVPCVCVWVWFEKLVSALMLWSTTKRRLPLEQNKKKQSASHSHKRLFSERYWALVRFHDR